MVAPPIGPVRLVMRCEVCIAERPDAEPFEAVAAEPGQVAFRDHLRVAHGMAADRVTLDAWLDRVRRGG